MHLLSKQLAKVVQSRGSNSTKALKIINDLKKWL